MMGNVLRGCFWIGLYLLLVLAPLFILLLPPVPPGAGFWWDFSLALGFAGTSMMAIMFVLTARFKRPSAPFGIDLVYYFHRQIALATFLLVLAHPTLLIAYAPAVLGLLDPRSASWTMWTGLLSLLALAALMASSLWRKQLRIHYDGWRLGHMLLAVAALALAVAHIAGVGHYSDVSWKKGVWLAILLSCAGIIVHVRLVRPWLLLRRPYQVVAVIPERGSATTLVLRPHGHQGFSFQPGQFVWLTLGSSPFAMKEHPFSISSSAQRMELTLTIKELGDFSNRIKDVAPGTRVYLDGPYGAFSIDRTHSDGFIFVAGGVGIAPIIGMLRTLADRGDKRPLLLFYAYSNYERLTFREELENLRERLDLKIVYVLNEPAPDWRGETGFLRDEIFARHLPAGSRAIDCFICGPPPMIAVAESGLKRQGIPLGRIHSELFDLV